MHKFFQKCCAAFFLTAAGAASANAQDIPPSPIAKTELVIDGASVHADGVVWAGVTFTMPEHWHIYWQNPGDSGIPTTLAWTVPEGISAGDIIWPAPERLETSGLVSYGYSGRVTLPVPLTVTGDRAHGPVTVTAKWLVCNDVCVPESATLTATLPGATPNAKSTLEAAILRAPQTAISTLAAYRAEGDRVILTIKGNELLPAGAPPITNVTFFPLADGIITNNDPQTFALSPDGTTLVLTLKRGSADIAPLWHGVIEITRGADVKRYSLVAGTDAGAAAPLPPDAPQENVTLLVALGLAFLGGLILNIMPCVLPILALKALAIAKKADASRAAAARQGLAYTAGVVLSFLLIAGGMLALKASGAAIGWGFQLQNSGFVTVLAIIMLLASANLLGLFELPILFGTRATRVNDDLLGGSFLTGALAVLVATPCTAPFMATAMGATLTLPTAQALLVFAALGFGMASPFLLISLCPPARRLLPKPGAWMKRFKHILAIPMLATAAWLVWVLVQLTYPAPMMMDANHEMYSSTRLQTLRESGTPVLVDATAAWCLTCKVNERVALRPAEMQQFFHDNHVTLMVADWTARDADITAYLASFNRSGVPIYVYYPPHGAPVVLPQILTQSLVRTTIQPH